MRARGGWRGARGSGERGGGHSSREEERRERERIREEGRRELEVTFSGERRRTCLTFAALHFFPAYLSYMYSRRTSNLSFLVWFGKGEGSTGDSKSRRKLAAGRSSPISSRSDVSFEQEQLRDPSKSYSENPPRRLISSSFCSWRTLMNLLKPPDAARLISVLTTTTRHLVLSPSVPPPFRLKSHPFNSHPLHHLFSTRNKNSPLSLLERT